MAAMTDKTDAMGAYKASLAIDNATATAKRRQTANRLRLTGVNVSM